MTRVTLTEEYVLIETDDIDFSVLRAVVESCAMKYKVRIKNTMFGYERDQIIEVYAESEQEALKIAQTRDIYADVTLCK